jgi:hypothetical protein
MERHYSRDVDHLFSALIRESEQRQVAEDEKSPFPLVFGGAFCDEDSD